VTGDVLVVDDEDDIRHLVRVLIENEEWTERIRVSEASGGQEAIDICSAAHVDVMVLDMHMPGIQGLEVLYATRSLKEPPSVVAWSADTVILRHAVRLGAIAAVSKTDVDGLLNAIWGCLKTA
jgi:CheY-like chemotaxis protein